MKSYIEMEQKQKECNEQYDILKKENPNDEKLFFYGDWVDTLDEYLIWNVVEYGEKIGHDFNSGKEIFEFTDEVKKEIVMTEEQARERIEQIKRELEINNKLKPFLRRLLKAEYDVLKWMLE